MREYVVKQRSSCCCWSWYNRGLHSKWHRRRQATHANSFNRLFAPTTNQRSFRLLNSSDRFAINLPANRRTPLWILEDTLRIHFGVPKVGYVGMEASATTGWQQRWLKCELRSVFDPWRLNDKNLVTLLLSLRSPSVQLLFFAHKERLKTFITSIIDFNFCTFFRSLFSHSLTCTSVTKMTFWFLNDVIESIGSGSQNRSGDPLLSFMYYKALNLKRWTGEGKDGLIYSSI